jgi:hypothetical protein
VLSLIHTLYNSLQHTLRLFRLLCLHQSLLSNGFQWQKFPLLWVPELSPCLSYQLLTAKHLITTELQFSNSLTNQLFTSLQCTALNEWNSTQAVAWYSLRANHTENTASVSTSIVARRMLPSNGLICHNTFIKPQLLPSKSFSIHHSTIILPFNAAYLATNSKWELQTEPSNSCLSDSVITYPLTVLQSGLRMTCANDVTSSVASKPSEPWTSTDAPSYKQIHLLSSLLVVCTLSWLFNCQAPVPTFWSVQFLARYWILWSEDPWNILNLTEVSSDF